MRFKSFTSPGGCGRLGLLYLLHYIISMAPPPWHFGAQYVSPNITISLCTTWYTRTCTREDENIIIMHTNSHTVANYGTNVLAKNALFNYDFYLYWFIFRNQLALSVVQIKSQNYTRRRAFHVCTVIFYTP